MPLRRGYILPSLEILLVPDPCDKVNAVCSKGSIPVMASGKSPPPLQHVSQALPLTEGCTVSVTAKHRFPRRCSGPRGANANGRPDRFAQVSLRPSGHPAADKDPWNRARGGRPS